MAIAPNTTFVANTVLTAAQQNAFGFSTVALATATANYALTTSIATSGLSVTFTAIANRNYKISWYEAQCQITNIASGVTTMQLRVTNAAGTLLQNTFAKNASTISGTIQVLCMYVGTFSAGSTTIVGCASTTSLSDAPALSRQATAPAFLLVEDIGPS
jgi:hypothetical protein